MNGWYFTERRACTTSSFSFTYYLLLCTRDSWHSCDNVIVSVFVCNVHPPVIAYFVICHFPQLSVDLCFTFIVIIVTSFGINVDKISYCKQCKRETKTCTYIQYGKRSQCGRVCWTPSLKLWNVNTRYTLWVTLIIAVYYILFQLKRLKFDELRYVCIICVRAGDDECGEAAYWWLRFRIIRKLCYRKDDRALRAI